MPQPPKVSVCIPVLNGIPFLKETLISARNQTWGNIEILISDDGSTDDSLAIANKMLAESDIPHFIYSNNRLGIAGNCNFLINASSGKYIKFLFQDDLLVNDCIEKLTLLAEEFEDTSIVFSKRKIISENNQSPACAEINKGCHDLHKHWSDLRRTQEGLSLLKDINLLRPPFNKIGEPSTVLLKKSTLEKVGGFDNNFHQLLDVDLWFRLMACGRVSFVDQTLSSFRVHEKQASVLNLGSSNMPQDNIILFDKLINNTEFQILGKSVKRRAMKRKHAFEKKHYSKLTKNAKSDSVAIFASNISKHYPLANKVGPLKLLAGKLTKYKSEQETFTALKNVSFNVEKGSTVGIIGLNGSGKSTLLQIIASILKPSSGVIKTNGRVAALLELGSGFNPDFSGIENIYLNASILGLERNEIENKLAEIMEFANIGDFINQPVRTYSSGMLMRLAFSVSIHVDPEILIIDEALAVGDTRFQAKCSRVFERFKESGKTLLLVTHDVNAVAQLCDSAILLHHGQIQSIGEPTAVINEYSRIIAGENPSPQKIGLTESILKPQKPDEASDQEDKQRAIIIEDERKQQPINSEEFSYGGEAGEIMDIQLHDSNGNATCNLKSGEMFVVGFKAKAHQKIQSPIFALTIRDKRGQDIYGNNTLFAKKDTADLLPNDSVEVTFQQVANLAAGEYLISLGFTRFEGVDLQVIHRKYDTIKLNITSSDGSFGIANCHSKINCTNPKNEDLHATRGH